MPVSLTDDRDFADLVREGRALLPIYAPEWTDHNPSDPGITLVELLAYFSDLLLYRIGRITPAAKVQFLRLLAGASRDAGPLLDASDAHAQLRAIDAAIDDAVAALAKVDRAVTPSDFERLSLQAGRRHANGQHAFVARCVADADLSGGRRSADVRKRGHVSVIVAAGDDVSDEDAARLRASVRRYLLPRCLLTTRLHVVAPDDLYVGIGLRVALRPGVSLPAAKESIEAALQLRFGGAQRFTHDDGSLTAALAGGAALRLSDVIKLVDALPGVDYVEDVTVLQLTLSRPTAEQASAALGVQIGLRSTVGVNTRVGGAAVGDARLVRDADGRLVSVSIAPWERLRLTLAHDGLREIGDAARDDPASVGSDLRGARDG